MRYFEASAFGQRRKHHSGFICCTPVMFMGDDVLLAIDLFGLFLIVIVLGPQIYRDRRRASSDTTDRRPASAVKPISMPDERR
jgi:hypothetical protein